MASNKSNQTIDPSVFAGSDEGAATGDTIKLPAGGFVVNFAEIPDAGEPVPAGTYDATIVAAEPTTSKAGNPMIKIRWRIDGGEHDKRNIFDNLVFTTAALWRVRQVLEALGYASNFNGAVNPESLIGESATIVVTIQAGNGVNPETGEVYPPRNNVAKVKPIGSGRKVADLL